MKGGDVKKCTELRVNDHEYNIFTIHTINI